MAGSAAAAALMHPLQALKEKLHGGRSQRQPSGRMFSYSRLSDAVRRVASIYGADHVATFGSKVGQYVANIISCGI